MPPDLADDLARTARLADGRELGYAELGRPDGQPLIWFHGTPSSRLEVVWLDQAAARGGWRLVAFDRPGHGLSSPHPGCLADRHRRGCGRTGRPAGFDRFSVMGYSGGAASALATASVLGSRVVVVGLVSPWGPPDRPGAYDGVAWSERMSDLVAGRAPAVTRAMFAAMGLVLRVGARRHGPGAGPPAGRGRLDRGPLGLAGPRDARPDPREPPPGRRRARPRTCTRSWCPGGSTWPRWPPRCGSGTATTTPRSRCTTPATWPTPSRRAAGDPRRAATTWPCSLTATRSSPAWPPSWADRPGLTDPG